jgi:hypothetical protein
LEKDRINIGKSWRELEILTNDRRTWNVIVTGLCPHGAEKEEYLCVAATKKSEQRIVAL